MGMPLSSKSWGDLSMKKIICKKEYDTENARIVNKYIRGFLGDMDGFEETLYQTHDGAYFLYTKGGPESPYPTENIKRMSKAAAEDWLKTH